MKYFTLKFAALAMLFISSCSLISNFSVSETIHINTSKENLKIVYKEVQEIIDNLDKQHIKEQILDKYPHADENEISVIQMQISMIEESFSSSSNIKKTSAENCYVTVEMDMNYDKSKSEEAHKVIKAYKTKTIEALKRKGISLQMEQK